MERQKLRAGFVGEHAGQAGIEDFLVEDRRRARFAQGADQLREGAGRRLGVGRKSRVGRQVAQAVAFREMPEGEMAAADDRAGAAPGEASFDFRVQVQDPALEGGAVGAVGVGMGGIGFGEGGGALGAYTTSPGG